jgi:hypothetical protein
MQTPPQTQAIFTMPVKPHRLIASDRVEQTPVRRTDGTKVGTIADKQFDWGHRDDVIGNLNFYRTPPY